jgi:hypothetical protein
VANLGRQALDLRDGFTHHLVAFAGLLVGSDGRFRGFSALRATSCTVAAISFMAVATWSVSTF